MLAVLTESTADAAEASAMQQADGPEPAAPSTPEPAAPAPAATPAPAAAPAPAEAPKPAAAAEPPADTRPKFVPHAALHEERTRRQALERELAELRRPAPTVATPEIDPETDPIGALKEIREWKATQAQREEQGRQIQEFTQRVQAHEGDFAAATPDYSKAIEHLRAARANQLKALGMPEQQIPQQLYREAMDTANTAFQNGRNPGEVFYELSKVMGYAGAAPAPAAETIAPIPEPAADTALAAKRAESDAALDRIARGQQAGRKTAGAGGETPSNEMTLEQLSNLTGAAFDNAMEKHGKRLFGG